EQQMVQFSIIEPTDEEVEAVFRQINDLHGVAPGLIRDAVAREIKRTNYFNQRFGQVIRPTEQEVRDYYDSVYVAEAQRRGAAVAPFETVKAQLEEQVAKEKLDKEVDQWLKTIKTRSEVEVF